MTKGIQFDPELKACRSGEASIRWQDASLWDEKSSKELPTRSFEVVAMCATVSRQTTRCTLGSRAIANRLHMSRSTVSSIFKALEDDGWLVKLSGQKYNPETGDYEAPEYALAVPERLAKDFDRFLLKEPQEAEPVQYLDELPEFDDVPEVELEEISTYTPEVKPLPMPEEYYQQLEATYHRRPEPTEEEIEDFRSRFGIKLAEPEPPERHLRLVS